MIFFLSWNQNKSTYFNAEYITCCTAFTIKPGYVYTRIFGNWPVLNSAGAKSSACAINNFLKEHNPRLPPLIEYDFN